jgi:HSP20 family protein
MIMTFTDPFEALFNLQRALEARLASDWLQEATTSRGPFPPINVFQQGDDILAIIELPGVDKGDLQIQAKENTIRISGKKAINFQEGVSVHQRRPPFGKEREIVDKPAQRLIDLIEAANHHHQFA